MREPTLNCTCGKEALLCFRDQKSSLGDVIVLVKHVPMYCCDACGFCMIFGSDFWKFGNRIRLAKKLNIPEIEFEEECS